jgi:hypothetical protein
MSGYYRILPEYIATHPTLIAEEKIFYSLLCSLISRYGFCWASNKYLASLSGKSVRSVKRYIQHLVDCNSLIVEVECHNDRKIWTPETWGNRDNLLKAYGEEIINSQESNQRFDRWATDDTGGGPRMAQVPTPLSNDNKKSKNIKHIEAWPKKLTARNSPSAPASEASFLAQKDRGKDKRQGQERQAQNLRKQDSQRPPPQDDYHPIEPPTYMQLSSQMEGPPPTPGSDEMVAETIELLKQPFKVGSSKVKMSPKDIKYFIGFSPTVIREAMEIMCKESWYGKRIKQFIPYLYTICGNVIKNRG